MFRNLANQSGRPANQFSVLQLTNAVDVLGGRRLLPSFLASGTFYRSAAENMKVLVYSENDTGVGYRILWGCVKL
jgi:hypothetical protein